MENLVIIIIKEKFSNRYWPSSWSKGNAQVNGEKMSNIGYITPIS